MKGACPNISIRPGYNAGAAAIWQTGTDGFCFDVIAYGNAGSISDSIFQVQSFKISFD